MQSNKILYSIAPQNLRFCGDPDKTPQRETRRNPSRFSAREFGNRGEDIAAEYLKKHGWKIITRNYAENGGEIDIVGYKRGKLAFFEVKTRSNESFGRPADAVDAAKTAKIKKAARAFRTECMRGGKVPVPFLFGKTIGRRVYKQSVDIIEIMLTHGGELLELNHIKEAEKL